MAEKRLEGEINVRLSGRIKLTLPAGRAECSIDDTVKVGIEATNLWSGSFDIGEGESLQISFGDMNGIDAGMGPGRDMTGRPFVAESIVAIMLRVSEDSIGDLEVSPGERPWRGFGSHLKKHGGSLGRNSVVLKSVPDTMPLVPEANQLKFEAVTGPVSFRLTIFTR